MDKINPDYYKNNSIETIEVIKNELTSEEFRGYLKGQVFKYLARHRLKNGLEDLRKAQWYMDYLVKFEEEIEEALH